MRTHAVPTEASAKGSARSETTTSATPTQASAGIAFGVEEVAHGLARKDASTSARRRRGAGRGLRGKPAQGRRDVAGERRDGAAVRGRQRVVALVGQRLRASSCGRPGLRRRRSVARCRRRPGARAIPARTRSAALRSRPDSRRPFPTSARAASTRCVASAAARFSAVASAMASASGAAQRLNSSSQTSFSPTVTTISGRSTTAGIATGPTTIGHALPARCRAAPADRSTCSSATAATCAAADARACNERRQAQARSRASSEAAA